MFLLRSFFQINSKVEAYLSGLKNTVDIKVVVFKEDPWRLAVVYQMEDGRTLLTGYRLTTLTFASDEDEKRHQCLGLKGWPSQPFWRFFGTKIFLLFGNFYVLLSGYMSGLRHCLHSHGSSACWMTYWNLEAAVSQKILYRKNVFLVLGGPSIFSHGPISENLAECKIQRMT